MNPALNDSSSEMYRCIECNVSVRLFGDELMYRLFIRWLGDACAAHPALETEMAKWDSWADFNFPINLRIGQYNTEKI